MMIESCRPLVAVLAALVTAGVLVWLDAGFGLERLSAARAAATPTTARCPASD